MRGLGSFVLRSPLGRFGLGVATLFLLSAALAPWLAPYDPTVQSLGEMLRPPSRAHWLGTDQYGRDVLSQVVYGGRVSLQIALVSVAVAALFGLPLGVVAGYYGGRIDAVIMRVMDVVFAFPSLLLAIALLAFVGPSTVNVMIAIGLVYVATIARITRASVLTVWSEEYVTAARGLGKGDVGIMARHVLPNALAAPLVQLTLGLARATLYEASLSFIGLGTPPPTPSWGRMLADTKSLVQLAPWASMAPGVAIMLVILSFNFLGDVLRDALDPRLRGLN
ncbi:MAG TPA: ABC transporter permease [Methylomirabilota bacterium]|nr:ABC transporter permease [Methylomirabilota bacterium]